MNTSDCIRQILKNIGENPNREGLTETPERVEKAYEQLLAGYKSDPKKILKTFTNENYDEMLLVRNIEYFSMCEHHMIPFFGMAHVAYIPDKKITGLSKIPRLIDAFAQRLQNQERMTTQVAETMFEVLKPKGVAVQITGTHLCISARGVQKPKSETVTTTFLGDFKTKANLQSDFLFQVSK